ncbi:MAG: hypothetical protein Hyperionvirus7_35 [Hyperionvirus sp.]|uniref:Uncharacterized protein n=1 Tax=Hyperionvirus sp. TaxID=2487770 RepID=A0A3G5AAC4_9VIRU|nr:MAG: hypothetical protein Hyperionvirus7_35 [Hyperionvirus sp.]
MARTTSDGKRDYAQDRSFALLGIAPNTDDEVPVSVLSATLPTRLPGRGAAAAAASGTAPRMPTAAAPAANPLTSTIIAPMPAAAIVCNPLTATIVFDRNAGHPAAPAAPAAVAPPPIADAKIEPPVKITNFKGVVDLVHHKYDAFRYPGMPDAEFNKLAFAPSYAFIPVSLLFMLTKEYEAACAKLPHKFDGRARGTPFVVDGISMMLIDRLAATFLGELLRREMKVVFLDKDEKFKARTEKLLETAGFPGATVWCNGEVPVGAYLKSRIPRLVGGLVYAVETDPAKFATYVAPDAFTTERVVPIHYLKFTE